MATGRGGAVGLVSVKEGQDHKLSIRVFRNVEVGITRFKAYKF